MSVQTVQQHAFFIFWILALAFAGVVFLDLIDGHSEIKQFYGVVFRFREGEHSSVIIGGFEAFKTAPAFGIGPGNYRHLAPSILLPDVGMRPDNYPHNYYVQILAETGVVGLTAA